MTPRLWYADIETLPQPGVDLFALAQTIKVDKRLKDPEKIKAAEAERYQKAIEQWRDTSLDPLRGFTYTIGYAIGNDAEPCVLLHPPQREYEGDRLASQMSAERILLEDVDEVLSRVDAIVTWYGFYFDIPWLIKRALKYKMYGLAQKLKAIPHHDLHHVWAMGDRKATTRLTDVAKFLGLKVVEGEIDGSQVFDAFTIGDHASVVVHQRMDIERLQGVGDALQSAGVWKP